MRMYNPHLEFDLTYYSGNRFFQNKKLKFSSNMIINQKDLNFSKNNKNIYYNF